MRHEIVEDLLVTVKYVCLGFGYFLGAKVANSPNASTVPLSLCHVHRMRHERDGGGAVWSLRARADARTRTQTEPTQSQGGIFMTKKKIPEETSVKTNSSVRRWSVCQDGKHANFLSEGLINLPP